MNTIQDAHFEAASTLAVVVSSNEPLLFLSEDQTVIAASASFCRAFGIDPDNSRKKPQQTWQRRMGDAQAYVTAEGDRFRKCEY